MLKEIVEFSKLLLQTILTVFKVLILSKKVSRKNRVFDTDRCLILGNGPSLKEVLKDAAFMQEQGLKICVNYFALSPHYVEVKPEFMVLQAPEFWIDNVNQSYIDNRQELFKTIVSKTNWNLVLWIPAKFKSTKKFHQFMQTNSFVKIEYFNDTPIEGFDWFKHLCFKKNIGIPRPHNVVVPSLMVALDSGFKEIDLVGVDHSWLNELSVNEDNEALVGQQHFYDEKTNEKEVMYKLGRRPRRLHEILEKFMLTFRAYFEIKAYADSKDVKIYNLTKGSFIDAFERDRNKS